MLRLTTMINNGKQRNDIETTYNSFGNRRRATASLVVHCIYITKRHSEGIQ
jgi:hypothetical protein